MELLKFGTESCLEKEQEVVRYSGGLQVRSLFASFCFARLLQYPCENFAFGRSAFGAFLLTPSSLGALGANFQINKKGGLLFYACGKVQSVVPKFAVYTGPRRRT